MTWSYDNSLGASKDQVRFLIGDTDPDDELLADEEIDWVLSQQAAVNYAAAACAQILGAKFARQVNTSNVSLSVGASRRSAQFYELAERLRKGSAGTLPGGDGTGVVIAEAFTGGTSISEKDAFYDDDDKIQPAFRRGTDDRPGTVTEQNHGDVFDEDPY